MNLCIMQYFYFVYFIAFWKDFSKKYLDVHKHKLGYECSCVKDKVWLNQWCLNYEIKEQLDVQQNIRYRNDKYSRHDYMRLYSV